MTDMAKESANPAGFREYDCAVHARFRDGPARDRKANVGADPPEVVYFLVDGESGVGTLHRYKRTDVNRNPNAPEPRATYQYDGQVT
jgi:hypothetical protein